MSHGQPLSKTHRAAFDAHLIGVDPDYRVHVAGQLLGQRDGPMLEALQGFIGSGSICRSGRGTIRGCCDEFDHHFGEFFGPPQS